MNKPTVPLPTDEAGHTLHCGSEIPAAQRQETTKEGGQAYVGFFSDGFDVGGHP